MVLAAMAWRRGKLKSLNATLMVFLALLLAPSSTDCLVYRRLLSVDGAEAL